MSYFILHKPLLATLMMIFLINGLLRSLIIFDHHIIWRQLARLISFTCHLSISHILALSLPPHVLQPLNLAVFNIHITYYKQRRAKIYNGSLRYISRNKEAFYSIFSWARDYSHASKCLWECGIIPFGNMRWSKGKNKEVQAGYGAWWERRAEGERWAEGRRAEVVRRARGGWRAEEGIKAGRGRRSPALQQRYR